MAFDPKSHLMNMRGKEYLEVKWRIVWFRSDHPGGNITTEMVSANPLMFSASIHDENGKLLATGHGSANAGGKNVVWSGREAEKAETAAIGRALAHAGYGTQFTGEDESDNLADSPVSKKAPPQQQPPQDAPNVWSGELINAIKAQVPRYKDAHTKQIIGALNKLERGEVPTMQIAYNQQQSAILATVKQYAKMRDEQDAGKFTRSDAIALDKYVKRQWPEMTPEGVLTILQVERLGEFTGSLDDAKAELHAHLKTAELPNMPPESPQYN